MRSRTVSSVSRSESSARKTPASVSRASASAAFRIFSSASSAPSPSSARAVLDRQGARPESRIRRFFSALDPFPQLRPLQLPHQSLEAPVGADQPARLRLPGERDALVHGLAAEPEVQARLRLVFDQLPGLVAVALHAALAKRAGQERTQRGQVGEDRRDGAAVLQCFHGVFLCFFGAPVLGPRTMVLNSSAIRPVMQAEKIAPFRKNFERGTITRPSFSHQGG